MKTIARDSGWALLAAIGVAAVLSSLNLAPLGLPWWVWLLVIIITIALIIWGNIPRKDKSEPPITPIVTDKTGTKTIVTKRSTWERFIEWWKNN